MRASAFVPEKPVRVVAAEHTAQITSQQRETAGVRQSHAAEERRAGRAERLEWCPPEEAFRHDDDGGKQYAFQGITSDTGVRAGRRTRHDASPSGAE